MNAHRTTTTLIAAAATLLLVSATGCSTAEPHSVDPDTSVAGVAPAVADNLQPAAGRDRFAGVPPEVRPELAAARAVSAPYHRVALAEADGYALPPAPAPLHECISAPDGHGAMGLHYILGANLDTVLDASRPEVLVYEPTGNGRLRLVALEYVVFEDAWKADNGDTTPQLFGRELTYVGADNRYDLPPFFQIHAWVWKHNPHGMFADHNPRVSCANGSDHGDRQRPDRTPVF